MILIGHRGCAWIYTIKIGDPHPPLGKSSLKKKHCGARCQCDRWRCVAPMRPPTGPQIHRWSEWSQGHLPLFVRIPSSSISPDVWGWKVAELGKRVGELVRARSHRTYGLGVHKCMYVLLLTHLHFNDFMIHSALSRRTASPRTNGPQIDIWSGRRCKWGMGLPKWPWIWNTVINHEIFGD